MYFPLSLVSCPEIWIGKAEGGSIIILNPELMFLGISINLLLVRTFITSCINHKGKDILALDSQRGSLPSMGDLPDSS